MGPVTRSERAAKLDRKWFEEVRTFAAGELRALPKGPKRATARRPSSDFEGSQLRAEVELIHQRLQAETRRREEIEGELSEARRADGVQALVDRITALDQEVERQRAQIAYLEAPAGVFPAPTQAVEIGSETREEEELRHLRAHVTTLETELEAKADQVDKLETNLENAQEERDNFEEERDTERYGARELEKQLDAETRRADEAEQTMGLVDSMADQMTVDYFRENFKLLPLAALEWIVAQA